MAENESLSGLDGSRSSTRHPAFRWHLLPRSGERVPMDRLHIWGAGERSGRGLRGGLLLLAGRR